MANDLSDLIARLEAAEVVRERMRAILHRQASDPRRRLHPILRAKQGEG